MARDLAVALWRIARLGRRDPMHIALAQTGGKVFGPRGAAALLGMKPTTVISRIKALGLERNKQQN
jgi:transcriptional regulator with GAF, ATPase, and Fis domain